MKDLLSRWWLVMLNGILFLLLGIFSIINPFTALVSAAVYIGVVALITGIVTLSAVFTGTNFVGRGWRIFEGAIDVLFGVLMLNNLVLSAKMIPVLIGIWVFLRGTTLIISALSLKQYYNQKGGNSMVIGFFLLIVGFFLMVDSRFGVMPIAYLLAITFVFLGVGSIFYALGMRSAKLKL